MFLKLPTKPSSGNSIEVWVIRLSRKLWSWAVDWKWGQRHRLTGALLISFLLTPPIAVVSELVALVMYVFLALAGEALDGIFWVALIMAPIVSVLFVGLFVCIELERAAKK